MNTIKRIAASIAKPPGYVVAACFVSIAGLLNGYDTGSIGAVTEMPFFEKQFGHLSPSMRGFTVSLIMLAGVFPSFFAGQLADRYGQLAIIMAGALTFSIGTVMEGAAYQLPVFLLGRALGGLGEGIWMSALAVYVTEIAPSARRGTLVSLPQLMVTAGICAGYFTTYATVHLPNSLSWRAPYIVQSVLGAILATSCCFLPQSPRWLLTNGHRDEAIEAIKRLDFSAVEAEKDLLGPAAEQQHRLARRPGFVEGLTMIFRKQYRKRTSLAFFMLGMIQMCGIDGVLYYAPTLFAQAGLPATTASFLASGLSAILMLAISIPAIIFTDRFPRRTIILVGGFLLTGCMLVIGALYASDSVQATAGAARWVVIVLVFVFGLTYVSTWGIVGKIYASEIQPAATRSAANCVAQGLGFFTNFVVAMLTPIFLANSTSGAYFLFGGFCLVTMLVLWAEMPETRGQSLEAIEEAFKQPLASGGKVASLLRRLVGQGIRGRSSGAPSSATSTGSPAVGAAWRAESIELRDALAEGAKSSASALETDPAMLGVGSI